MLDFVVLLAGSIHLEYKSDISNQFLMIFFFYYSNIILQKALMAVVVTRVLRFVHVSLRVPFLSLLRSCVWTAVLWSGALQMWHVSSGPLTVLHLHASSWIR